MAKKRLENLIILLCESDIKINTKEVINNFVGKIKLFEKSFVVLNYAKIVR